MNADLTGRGILVTGGSGGIGTAIVRELVACGAAPWVHYRSQENNALSLCRELGLEASRAVSADLRKEDEVEQLFGEIAAVGGGVSGLVVNAGIWEPLAIPVRDMTLDQWRGTMASNLESAFLCCRGFLRRITAESPPPSIVLIGSTAGVFGEEGHGDYAASKAAMGGLMLTLKNEIVRQHPLGRVNLVNPGWVATPMASEALEDQTLVARVTATVALRKVAAPEDVATAVVYLLSDRLAGHVSGQAITVAGGMEGRLLHG